jgi:hypothetical protein
MTRTTAPFPIVAILPIGAMAPGPVAPIVTMSVTLPDGRTQALTAAESGLAALTLKDGTEFGFRPRRHAAPGAHARR